MLFRPKETFDDPSKTRICGEAGVGQSRNQLNFFVDSSDFLQFQSRRITYAVMHTNDDSETAHGAEEQARIGFWTLSILVGRRGRHPRVPTAKNNNARLMQG